MATTKVTFTLDEATIQLIENAAKIQHKPKSQVIRDAVKDYHARIGRLSESESRRLLHIFDTMLPLIPARPQAEVDQELAEIRRARQSGGRLHGEGI
jgi:uncharacterized protein (DUF1778 family)